jgi:hypothetical protein
LTLSPFRSIFHPRMFRKSFIRWSCLDEACEWTCRLATGRYRAMDETYINIVILPPKRGFGPPTSIKTCHPACLVIDSAAT